MRACLLLAAGTIVALISAASAQVVPGSGVRSINGHHEPNVNLVPSDIIGAGGITSSMLATGAAVTNLGYIPAWTGTVIQGVGGLTGGGDLSAARTISIATGGVTGTMLATGAAIANIGYPPAWAGIVINAGAGLTGGGDLSAGRTLAIATSGVTSGMLASGAAAANIGAGGVTAAMLAAGAASGNLGFYPASVGTQIVPGAGLSGGGHLDVDRTVSIATGGVTSSMLASGAAVGNIGYAPLNPTGGDVTNTYLTRPGGVAEQLGRIVAGPCLQIDLYGADPSGYATSDGAWNAIMTAVGSSNGCVAFGPGIYKFGYSAGKALASQQNIRIAGAGKDVTNLYWPSGGGMVLARGQQSTFTIDNLTLTTGANGGSNAITLSDNTGNCTAGAKSQSVIANVAIRGWDGIGQTNYWDVGVYATNLNLLNTYNVDIFGEGTHSHANGYFFAGTDPGATPGCSATNATLAVIFNVTGGYLQSLYAGMILGTQAQGITVTQTNFNADSVGITTTTGAYALDELVVLASQFNTYGDQIQTRSAFIDVNISGNLFFIPAGYSGINFQQGAAGGQVIGNFFQNSDYSSGGFGTQGGNGIAMTNAPYKNMLTVVGNNFADLVNGAYYSSTGGAKQLANTYFNVTNHANTAGGCASCSIGVATD